jgi:hypothetical protein
MPQDVASVVLWNRSYATPHCTQATHRWLIRQANQLCTIDNAVSIDGTKLLVSYLDEFAKSI